MALSYLGKLKLFAEKINQQRREEAKEFLRAYKEKYPQFKDKNNA